MEPTSEQRRHGAGDAAAPAIIDTEGRARKVTAEADRAARSAGRLTAFYLGATAVLLATEGRALPAALAALHGLLAWSLIRRARGYGVAGGSGLADVAADWAPLLLAPLLYWELPLLMEALPGPVRYHDPAVAAMEMALFGVQPAFAWGAAWPWPALSESLHAAYLSYYPLIYVPPLALYLRARKGGGGDLASVAFHETVLALAVSFYACFLVFIAFPVQGPRYLGVSPGLFEGPVRRTVLAVLERGSSRGAAFPSSHVAVAVAQAAMALRWRPRTGLWLTLLALALAAGAVYGGFHYGVDVLAGAAVGIFAVPAARVLLRSLGAASPGFTSPPSAG